MDKEKLIAMLKERGLNFAEDQLKDLVDAMLDILVEVVKLTDNKLDDMLVPMLEIAKPTLYEMIDKVDGREG